MSYAIACARAEVFRGVAIYNGAQLSWLRGGTKPIAYWQMAGLTDDVCKIGPGRQMRDKFVANNGCTTQSPPEPPQPPLLGPRWPHLHDVQRLLECSWVPGDVWSFFKSL